MAFQDNTKRPWKKAVKRKEFLQKSSPSDLLWNSRAERWHGPPYKGSEGAEKNNLQIALKSKVVDF